MAELATSPRYRAYLDHLISELDRAMEIAQTAKAKGFDPRAEVEIPIASDLAGRVEALLGYKGVAARIRELEERMSREEASLKIGDAFVSREFGETTREEIPLRRKVSGRLVSKRMMTVPSILSSTMQGRSDLREVLPRHCRCWSGIMFGVSSILIVTSLVRRRLRGMWRN